MTNYKSSHTNTILFVVFMFCLSNVRIIKSLSFAYHELAIQEGAEYVPGQMLVRFAPNEGIKQKTTSEKHRLLSNLGNVTINREYDIVPGLTLVTLPKEKSIEDALLEVSDNKDILYAHPNYLLYALLNIPNDPKFNEQWGVNNTGKAMYSPALEYYLSSTSDSDIDTPETWNMIYDNDIIIAVIDSGIDYNHPDLQDNIWRNPLEEPNDANNDGYPGIQGIDDDGDGLIDEDSMDNEPGDPNYTNDLVNDDDENGFNDDIYGYDFCTRYGKQRDSDPMDDYLHGTHCSGIIGATGNNSTGVVGICWNVKIMAIKFLAYDGSGITSDAIDSIEYAVQMGAKILSNSWGGGYYSEGLEETIANALEEGVLFIASAGNIGYDNDSYPHYPSSYDLDNVISVLSTDFNDKRSYHDNLGYYYSWVSNYGKESVDLGAPGSNILSTFPTYMTTAMQNPFYNFHTYYDIISGTSMAAPHVAGACALVWAANPNLTHLEVKQKIMDAVDPLDDLVEKCVTEGRLNVCNAVLAAGPLKIILDDNLEFNPDPNDISVNEEITYTIYYENTPYDPLDPNSVYIGPATNAVLFDYLPDQVDFVSAWPTGSYDEPNHVYMWDLGDLDPNDYGEVYLTVRVNERAEPGGVIDNMAAVKADIQDARTISGDRIYTPLDCCSGIIYVDQNATGYNNGACWQDAMTEFHRALDKAQDGCITQIRVAEGTYLPDIYWDGYSYWLAEPFAIPSGVSIYGGFSTGGGENERDPWQNLTILHGNSDRVYNYDLWLTLDQVVHLINCNEQTVLDGFTINDSYGEFIYGVYIENGSPTVSHNLVTDQDDYGVYITGGSAKITHNKIDNNGQGIYVYNADAPAITNNWIYKNSLTGLYLDNVSSDAVVRNNTIAYNQGDGVVKWGGAADPNIVMENCIVWKNDGEQVLYCPAKYSCIYDPVNDPNGVNIDADEAGNITTNPLFFSAEDDDFHLDPNSPCIDTGDPEGDYQGEKDIDGQRRVLHGGYGLVVDMGADEFCGGTDTNYADFNDDDFVDLFDYAELAHAWLTEPNELNPIYDLNADEIVSLVDLYLFTDEWLWMACWNQQTSMMMSQGYGGGSEAMQSQSSMTAPTKPQPQKITVEQLWELIHWLEELRQTDEYAQKIPEDEWLDFMKRVYLGFDYLE